MTCSEEEQSAPRCLRCGAELSPGDPWKGFCSSEHRREGRRQVHALQEAGPGCKHCIRGAVFFDWRPEGGRQRSSRSIWESSRVAPCWCDAGRALDLKNGYKAWGYMRDVDEEGNPVRAPRVSPLERCRTSEDSE